MKKKNFENSEERAAELAELMRAIILRSIEDLKQGGEYAEDARNFFEEVGLEDPHSHPFSFSSICAYLGLNPKLTRERIYSLLENNERLSTRRRLV